MYKVYHQKVPDILSRFFVYNTNIHDHFTRQHQQFHVQRPRSNLSKNSIRYFGVTIWNTIYNNVDVNVKLSRFKKELKILLLKDY